MSEIRDRGLLLRRIPYGDGSLIVHMLTAGHGRLALMARSARRANNALRPALAPLHDLALAWHAGRTGMGTLRFAERGQELLPPTHALAGLELTAVAAGLYPEGGVEGYRELHHAIGLLAAREQHSGLLAAVWDLMHRNGWVGSLGHCWHCGQRSKRLFWSEGELYCSGCGGGAEINEGLRRSMLGLLREPRVYLSPRDLELWQLMTQELLRRHGLRPLRLQTSAALP